MKRFHDRVVVVTGGGSGIGRATARAFAKRGARVHVVDIDAGRADDVAAELRADGAVSRAHQVDVRESRDVEALADHVYGEHGRVDVLVNNAGVGHSALIHETTLDDWKWVLETNLWGVIHGVHAFVPRMIDQGGDAHVINTASVAGLAGLASMAPYCSSKFAVMGLSESLAIELMPHGIGVTAVCPGIIDTDIVRAGKVGGALSATKAKVVKYYKDHGISPDRVASDIVSAVQRGRPIALTAGVVYPALLLRSLSPRLYRRVASLAHRYVTARGNA